MSSDTRVCSRCGERQPIDNYYFVSKKSGIRRGECKSCRVEKQRMQKDPAWKPVCAGCGEERDRLGPGRRLCRPCFTEKYDLEDRRPNGSHRRKLNPCRACGVERLRADHEPNTMLCPVCRSVPQTRRKRLKALYNISPREYVEMLEAQRYRCAICSRRPRTTLHVDHKHSPPMAVRGLLCATCNTLLGVARDRPEVLAGAIRYLDAPPAQEILPGREAHPEANRSFRPLTRMGASSLREAA